MVTYHCILEARNFNCERTSQHHYMWYYNLIRTTNIYKESDTGIDLLYRRKVGKFMGKKDEFFKWYRENANKFTIGERKKADNIVQEYALWHDGLEDAIHNTPNLQNREGLLEALDQMTWEDARLQMSRDMEICHSEWLVSYIRENNGQVRYIEKDNTVQVYKIFHTSHGDIEISYRPIDARLHGYIALQAKNLPEVDRRYYELNEQYEHGTAPSKELLVASRAYDDAHKMERLTEYATDEYEKSGIAQSIQDDLAEMMASEDWNDGIEDETWDDNDQN